METITHDGVKNRSRYLGRKAFELYTENGFPLECFLVGLRERSVEFDETELTEVFKNNMRQHSEKSKGKYIGEIWQK